MQVRLATGRIAVAVMTAVAASAVALASPAGAAIPACSGPDGQNQRYDISNWTAVNAPTSVASSWQDARYGGSISYSKSTTMTVSASTTATVSAEAGIIFAKASTSIGVTVGGSYSKGSTWTNTMTVPSRPGYKTRMHLYWTGYTFEVTKYAWTCPGGWKRSSGYPAWVYHAPAPYRTDTGTFFLDWAKD